MASPERLELMPDLPTIAEQLGAPFESGSFIGFFVPVGTPDDIREKLSAATQRVLAQPEIAAQVEKMGGIKSRTGMGPSEFDAYWHADFDQWGTLIRELNIKPEGQ